MQSLLGVRSCVIASLVACSGASAPSLVATSTSGSSFPLLNNLLTDGDNLLVSPLSISTCFSLVLPGARGETETQIRQALSYPVNSKLGRDETYAAFTASRENYNSQYPMTTAQLEEWETAPPAIQIANSIWVDQSVSLQPVYQELVQDLLVVTDFQDSSASTKLNAWCSNHTNGKITQIVQPGPLPGVLIAVNAVYFKSTWSYQFKKQFTGTGTFFADVSKTSAVNSASHFMHQVEYFLYTRTQTHQILALPYDGTTVEMLIALPLDIGEGADNRIGLSESDLTAAVASLTSTRIALALPKFEFWSDYTLNDALKAMGMVVPFDGDAADFSGFSASTKLFISKVLHKTFIAVDEFGTEAAAVTAIIMEATSVGTSKPQPILFNADHPFLLFIHDRKDRSILFAGRVADPKPPAGSATPAFQVDGNVWSTKFGEKPKTASSTTSNSVSMLLPLALLVCTSIMQYEPVLLQGHFDR